MRDYRLYLFRDGERLPSVMLNCGDDDGARKLALDHAEGRQYELWCGRVFVASRPTTPSSRPA